MNAADNLLRSCDEWNWRSHLGSLRACGALWSGKPLRPKVSHSLSQWSGRKLQKRVWAKPKWALAPCLRQVRHAKARRDFLWASLHCSNERMYWFVTFSCQNVLDAVLQSDTLRKAVGRHNSQSTVTSLTLTPEFYFIFFAVNNVAGNRIKMSYFGFLFTRILVEWELPPWPSPLTTWTTDRSTQFPVETLLQSLHH